MDLGRLIHDLSQPLAHPGAVDEVEVVQTHASVVFLAGESVYKVKKPVDLGFLNYSTLERRREFCEREVALNRRLAPTVYRGVVPVVAGAQGLKFGGDGHAVEWAVHMRRLPDEATARARLAAGTLGESELVDIARRVAAFHRSTRGASEARPHARFDVVAANCLDNFTPGLASVLDPGLLARIRRATEDALERHRSTIESRVDDGFACELHGDLRLEHVYLFPDQEPPNDLAIIDCIEFNDCFRHGDPIIDIAFLAMELHAEAAWRLAESFVAAYGAASGDPTGAQLLPLFLSYRAMVRAKVEAIRASEAEVPPDQREAALVRTRAMALLALAELVPPEERPALILVGGLPGTGKSVLAGALHERGAGWLRADVVRKRLAGLDPMSAGPERLYTTAWSDRTYAELARQAEAALQRGERVVVDATLIEARRRAPFVELARRSGARLLMLYCDAPSELVRARIAARRDDPSDADVHVYDRLAARCQPPTDQELDVIRIDASGAPLQMHAQALEALRVHGLAP